MSDGIIAPGFEPAALEILRAKKGGKYIVLQPSAGAKTSIRFTGALQQPTRPGAFATHMERFLRDLREARDACNKLPFDDARACRCRRRRRHRRRVSPRRHVCPLP